jgi:predicted nucleic acid-binding protein
MILVDTGPLVALFDPKHHAHRRCRRVLEQAREPLRTTVPVLTEAFHMLGPSSTGSDRLRDFILAGGLGAVFLDYAALVRAFELMEQYADHPMDLADASLIVAAERLNSRRIFTIDRSDFHTYRARRGHRHYGFDVIG